MATTNLKTNKNIRPAFSAVGLLKNKPSGINPVITKLIKKSKNKKFSKFLNGFESL